MILSRKRQIDPSLLDPKIRELQKKLVNAIREVRSKSLDKLLLYMHLDAFEREMLVKNFQFLLDRAVEEMKRNKDKYFGWAIFFANWHFKQYYKIGLPPLPQGDETPSEIPKVPKLDKELSDVLDTRFNNLMADVRQELLSNIHNTIERARITPMSSADLKEALDKHYDRAIMRVRMIAETEMMFAYNAFMIREMKVNGIMKVQWVTARDELVCDDCGRKHLKIYDIDKIPEIPAHPRCRCVVIPVLK